MRTIRVQTLKQVLSCLQRQRGFSLDEYLSQKSAAINHYFTRCGLDSAILGISGGVDSAVVLALLKHAKEQQDSPIKEIVPLLLPIHGRGSTEQDVALKRGQQLCKKLHIKAWTCDLSSVQQQYIDAFPIQGDAWAEGQLLSVVRTPALYYAAALLQCRGRRSLVVGTTNRDEGAYLGFFGKASDGMVDLQPISDIHKSEVWALAKHLDVTQEIIDAVPSGNVYDGKTDEEMIQAPYWFIELYLMAKSQNQSIDISTLLKSEQELYRTYSEAIEQQHRKNTHKYWVGSPAVHLDIMPRGVPGGWTCPQSR